MVDLVRIAPPGGALTIGKPPLPWDVFDAEGNILLRQGYVIQTNGQLEQLFERGRFKPPRKIERPKEETFEDLRQRNPFAEYGDLLTTLEVTLNAITSEDPTAQKRLLGLCRMLDKTCQEAPDASLALVHLYSIGPLSMNRSCSTASCAISSHASSGWRKSGPPCSPPPRSPPTSRWCLWQTNSTPPIQC